MGYLILVRHGQSTGNLQEIICGHMDVPLTEVGHQQARHSAEALRGIAITAVFSSPLQRAHDTAQDILNTLSIDAQIRTNSALSERSWGDLEGQPITHPADQPEGYNDPHAIYFEWGGRAPGPGGESYADVARRALPYLDEEILPLAAAGQNVLLVSHRGTLKVIRRFLEEKTAADIHTLDPTNGEVFLYGIGSDQSVVSFRKLGSPPDAQV